MDLRSPRPGSGPPGVGPPGSGLPELLIVVGSGGVGKTTLAASLGLESAAAGHDTLVMTFDPSLRLKDALGVGDAARDEEVAVPVAGGRLWASLLDARRTFDRLITRHAASEATSSSLVGAAGCCATLRKAPS